MKSLRSSERFLARETWLRLISSMSCFSLEQVQGALPCRISKKMTPMDQMSFLGVQMLFWRASGLMQSGEPTLTASLGLGPTRLAKPKSAILTVLSQMRMLAGLRSRCRKPLSEMWMKPMSISRMRGRASSSESLPRFLRRCSRSPSLQNSVMMQQLLAVLKISWHLMMWGWLSFLRASISPSSMRFSGLPWMALMSMTLMATFSLFLSLLPRQTTELKPRPITSFSPYEQSYIFFRRSLLPCSPWLSIQIRYNCLLYSNLPAKLNQLSLYPSPDSLSPPLLCFIKMDDRRCHIKKEIASLARRSESGSRTGRQSMKGATERLSVPEMAVLPFWQEFRRERGHPSASEHRLIPRKQNNWSPLQATRCKSAFYRQMLSVEDHNNSPLRNKRSSKEMKKPEETPQIKLKAEPMRSMIEGYLYKPSRTATGPPRSPSRPGTPGEEAYLQAKLGGECRPLFSQGTFRLFKV